MKKFLCNVVMIVCIFNGMNVMDGYGQASDFNNSGCISTNADADGDCSAAVGTGSLSAGANSIALGRGSQALGGECISIGTGSIAGTSSLTNASAFGSEAWARGSYSVALGTKVETASTAIENIVIGVAKFAPLVNNISNSLMIGMNSDFPTMYVSNSGGASGSWGRVGIGTTAPIGLLHLRDEAGESNELVMEKYDNTLARLRFQQGTSFLGHLTMDDAEDMLMVNRTNNRNIAFWINQSSTQIEAMRIEGSSANVGIGTTAPVGRLHVNHATANTDVVIQRNGSNAARLRFHTGATAAANLSLTPDNDLLMQGLTSNRNLLFNVNMGGTDTEAMRVDGATSWVGIGTTTPYGRLNVRNDVAFSPGNDQNGSNSLVLYGGVSNATNEHYGAIVWQNFTSRKKAAITSVMGTADDDEVGIAFWTRTDDVSANVQERMRVSYNGNVGIGTTNPVNTLHVAGTARTTGTTFLATTGGNVGIGTTGPSGRLHVAGTAFVNTLPGGSAVGPVGFLSSNQLMDLNSSSMHFKENIEGLEFDREAFLSMSPVSYRWKEFYGGSEDVGFVAQQVAETFPPLADIRHKHFFSDEGEVLRDTLTGLAIVDSAQTEPYGVKYHKLPVYLFMLAKQQDSVIQALSERLDYMQGLVDECCSRPSYRMDEGTGENGAEQRIQDVRNEFVLMQNDPNPFSDYTDIRISLPDNVRDASLLIVDMKGTVVLNVNLHPGQDRIRVYSSDIGKGIFTYYLLSGSNVIASRKMVSTK